MKYPCDMCHVCAKEFIEAKNQWGHLPYQCQGGGVQWTPKPTIKPLKQTQPKFKIIFFSKRVQRFILWHNNLPPLGQLEGQRKFFQDPSGPLIKRNKSRGPMDLPPQHLILKILDILKILKIIILLNILKILNIFKSLNILDILKILKIHKILKILNILKSSKP